MIPILMMVGSCIVGGFYIAGIVQYIGNHRFLTNRQPILALSLEHAIEEERMMELKRKQEYEEEEKRKNAPYYLDVLVKHGSAFGGFSSILSDGRRRKGIMSLDQIMMYGRPVSGNDMTYYIEEQGIEICATEQADELLIRSKLHPFKIRDEAMNRDQGISCMYARLQKDVLYYIMLESKHEISIKASRCC